MTELHSSLFVDALKETTTRRFQGKKVQIDDFVSIFSDAMYEVATPYAKKQLLAAAVFISLKAYLYVVFRKIDTDEDGYVSWDDVMEYALEERAAAVGTESNELLARFSLSRTLAFNPLLKEGQRLHAEMQRVAAKRKYEAEKLGVAVPDHGDDIDEAMLDILPMEPIYNVKYFPHCNKIFALCKPHDTYILNDTLDVLAEIPYSGFGTVSGNFIGHQQGDLLVTSHRDHSLLVWNFREKMKMKKVELSLLYEHQCSCVQLSGLWWEENPDCFFTGGVRGDINLWRFTPELLAEYRRGDPTAFTRISVASWNPGEFHHDAVTGMLMMPKAGPLATCSHDATIAVHDMEKNIKIRSLAHKKGLYAMTLCSSYHDVICSVGFEFTPYVWDIAAKGARPTLLTDTRDPHIRTIVSVESLRDSPVVITCDTSAKVKFWDLRMLRCFQTVLADRTATSRNNNLASSMTGIAGGSSFLVAGRCLSVIQSESKTDPLNCYTSPVVGVAFDNRTGQLLTAHSTVVVCWSTVTGLMICVHHFTPKVSSESEKEAEMICAFLIAEKGQNYYVGTTYGRVRTFKISTGEEISDTGRVHNCEVNWMIQGFILNNESFVLSVGVDGSCHFLTSSSSIPPFYSFSHCIPTCAVFSKQTCNLIFGTDSGSLMTVDPTSILSKGPLSVYSLTTRCEVTALTLLEGLSVIAAADSNGHISFWGVKPAPITGCQLFCVNIPKRCGDTPYTISALESAMDGMRCIVMGIAENGTLLTWEVKRTIFQKTTLENPPVVLLRKQALHKDAAKQLVYASTPKCFISAAFDETVKCFTSDGKVIAQLCHARGMQNVEWPDGLEPPFHFPCVMSSLGALQQKSERTISIIHDFLAKLRQKVLQRKSGQDISFAFSGAVSAVHSPSFVVPSNKVDLDACSTAEAPTTSTEAEDAQSFKIALPPPRPLPAIAPSPRRSSSASLASVRENVRAHGHNIAPKARVAICPSPPSVPRLAEQSNKLETYLFPSASPKQPLRREVGKCIYSMTTEERINLCTGQLVVLQTDESKVQSARVECSHREIVPVMERQYNEEEGQAREKRNLSAEMVTLRHAIGKEHQKKFRKLQQQLTAIEQAEKLAAFEKEEKRQAMLRGPPLPAAPRSRRLRQ